MPSAYAESRKDKEKVVREDIGGLMAELSRRPQTPERTRKLTGPERAAVLMLSLGEQYGAKIFGLLDDDELREISIVMLLTKISAVLNQSTFGSTTGRQSFDDAERTM